LAVLLLGVAFAGAFALDLAVALVLFWAACFATLEILELGDLPLTFAEGLLAAFVLVAGLVASLAAGLTADLGAGFAAGLAAGFVTGLVAGFAVGFAFALGFALGFALFVAGAFLALATATTRFTVFAPAGRPAGRAALVDFVALVGFLLMGLPKRECLRKFCRHQTARNHRRVNALANR